MTGYGDAFTNGLVFGVVLTLFIQIVAPVFRWLERWAEMKGKTNPD